MGEEIGDKTKAKFKSRSSPTKNRQRKEVKKMAKAGMLHIERAFTSKADAELFCAKKNKTATKYRYHCHKAAHGGYFVVGGRKRGKLVR